MILAVDFGTSNSLAVVATADGHSAPLALDPKAKDPSIFRTLLYFPHQDQCFYGQQAIDEHQNNLGTGRFIRSVKKFLPSKEFQGTWIENKPVKLEDLVGLFLLETRKRAERVSGEPIAEILLGRPAQYSEDASADKLAVFRMEKAAEFAGFSKVSFFEEPIAAALDLRTTLTTWKTVLIVDLGGGTSDFTVMKLGPDEFLPEHVLAKGAVSVAGDVIDGETMSRLFSPFFGSGVQYRVPLGSNIMTMPPSLLSKICSPADITQLLRSDYMHFLKQVQQWSLGPDDKKALERLFTLCEDHLGFSFFERIEEMKKDLSKSEAHAFDYPYPTIEISKSVPKKLYDRVVQKPIDKIFLKMDQVISQSGLTSDQIDFVYCTGGTSHMAGIQTELIARFGQERVRANKHFHSVIDGLGERASQIERQSQ